MQCNDNKQSQTKKNNLSLHRPPLLSHKIKLLSRFSTNKVSLFHWHVNTNGDIFHISRMARSLSFRSSVCPSTSSSASLLIPLPLCLSLPRLSLRSTHHFITLINRVSFFKERLSVRNAKTNAPCPPPRCFLCLR